jgi:hypothetical protein
VVVSWSPREALLEVSPYRLNGSTAKLLILVGRVMCELITTFKSVNFVNDLGDLGSTDFLISDSNAQGHSTYSSLR